MAKKYKHLSESDVKILKEDFAESDENISQIDEFYPHVKVKIDNKKSTMKKARELLSQRTFLASLDRAVFHGSTSQELTNAIEGNSISFDSYDYRSKFTDHSAELQPIFDKYQIDPTECTTNELTKLCSKKWIKNIDLWASLVWDAGFGETDETMEEQYNKGKDIIEFDTTIYGMTQHDKNRDYNWDDFIWIDCLPTKFNLKTKKFEFDTSELTKKQLELFKFAKPDIEIAQLRNLEDNMPAIFEPRKKIGK